MAILWILVVLITVFLAFCLGWCWASRICSVPWLSVPGWSLEHPLLQRLNGTLATLDRLGLRPGQKILEIGPGQGRLLVPAAERVLPDGEAVGIDNQPGMIDRLKVRAEKAGITNLTAILGDATQPHVPSESFDLVFLCTTLGRIADRAAALTQCYQALKPGGMLSITETLGDAHYLRRSVIKRLAKAAGFRFQSTHITWWLSTINFVKP